MYLIRQHPTVYNAAKILALLGLVLLNSQKVGFALSYWDAIFEIGFNPDTTRIDSQAACRQIERLIKFRNAIHEKPEFDDKLDTEIREVEMVRNRDKLSEDIRGFAQQLWKAFYLDFLRIKLLKYCR